MTDQNRTAETIRAEIADLETRRATTGGHSRRARITAALESLAAELRALEIVAEVDAAEARDIVTSADGETLRKIKVSDLTRGEFFKRKPDAAKVYARGEYDRGERKYWADDQSDISRGVYLKGAAIVYIGFTY